MPLTTVILVELIQGFQSRDRRLVYREFPGHILAGLPRGLLPRSRRLRLLQALLRRLPAFRSLTARVRRFFPRLAASRTLGASSVRHGHHTAPGIIPFWFRAFVERTVPVVRKVIKTNKAAENVILSVQRRLKNIKCT